MSAAADGTDALPATGGTDALPSAGSPSSLSAPEAALLSTTERFWIATLSSLQGLLFGWSGWVLPWDHLSTFCVLSLLLAAGFLGVVVCAGLLPHWVGRAWRLSALLALGWLLLVSWHVFTGGAYLAGLYGSLGEGLFAALLAVWGLAVLLTLPTSIWALVRTREHFGFANWRRWLTFTLACALLAIASRCGWLLHTAEAAPSVHASHAQVAQTLEPLQAWATRADTDAQGGADNAKASTGVLGKPQRVQCPAAPDPSYVTLIASFARTSKGQTRYISQCAQAATLEQAVSELLTKLKKERPALPIQLDVISAVAPLDRGPDWIRTFELRPGLDGACLGKRCWLPWQLLAADALIENQPLPFIADLKFGAAQDELREQLAGATKGNAAPDDAEPALPLMRIETYSWLLNTRGLHATRRMRPVDVPLAPKQLQQFMHSAEAHIATAQLSDGKFRYMLHPFSGVQQTKKFNLPRQAGTALVLCELGQGPEVTTTIERALQLLVKHERPAKDGSVSGLSYKTAPQQVGLEDSALALVALLECRKRVGNQFDATIRRLTGLVLSTQQDDGSFFPRYDFASGQAVQGARPLYAIGQAILALTLLEAQLILEPNAEFPDQEMVRSARLRAMKNIAQQYWPAALYPFFFIEENWHCLAARAALPLVREPAYERFCIDYVAFKTRLILAPDSAVDPAFIGGMGFGNVVPPHNTGAAGFGEALSAAISVKLARGEAVSEMQTTLAEVIGFLLRQQWTPDNCFGCAPAALGSISEHTHSPVTRIDFVQHAWAAVGHGSRVLHL